MKKYFLAIILLTLFVSQVFGDEPIATLKLNRPTSRAVFQRNSENQAKIPIAGTFTGKVTKIEASFALTESKSDEKTKWHEMTLLPEKQSYSGTLTMPAGGWYRVKIRAFIDKKEVSVAEVEKVGVGEVFITAGQSNSANHGGKLMAPTDDRVSAWGPKGWRLATDPQPIATGRKGTPWPILGDLLAKELDVPIGFISVGWGGTTVGQWQPKQVRLFQRLKIALEETGGNGLRAILWHQGESDTIKGTSAIQYSQMLQNIIDQSRKSAGWDVPWVIAGVAYIGAGHRNKEEAIRKGQKMVCNGKDVFEGPDTDELIGRKWRFDGVHFSEEGLREHASRWAKPIIKIFYQTRPGKKK